MTRAIDIQHKQKRQEQHSSICASGLRPNRRRFPSNTHKHSCFVWHRDCQRHATQTQTLPNGRASGRPAVFHALQKSLYAQGRGSAALAQLQLLLARTHASTDEEEQPNQRRGRGRGGQEERREREARAESEARRCEGVEGRRTAHPQAQALHPHTCAHMRTHQSPPATPPCGPRWHLATATCSSPPRASRACPAAPPPRRSAGPTPARNRCGSPHGRGARSPRSARGPRARGPW